MFEVIEFLVPFCMKMIQLEQTLHIVRWQRE